MFHSPHSLHCHMSDGGGFVDMIAWCAVAVERG